MQALSLCELEKQLSALTKQRNKLTSALSEVAEKIEIVECRREQLKIEQEFVAVRMHGLKVEELQCSLTTLEKDLKKYWEANKYAEAAKVQPKINLVKSIIQTKLASEREGSACLGGLVDVERFEGQESDEKNGVSKEDCDHIKVSDPDYRDADDGAFTSYLLIIQFEDPVERRYKQFSWLHNQLTDAYPNVRVPELPERVCGQARFNPGFIAQRCTELEVYINKVARHKTLSRHPDVWAFLHADTETIARAMKEKWDDDEPYRPLTQTCVEPNVLFAKSGQLFGMTTINIAQSQALYVAAKLGIADILWRNRRSMTVHELAQETKTNEKCLYRVLRFLGLTHIFDVDFETKRVTLNSTSRHLVSVHPFSALAGLIITNEEQFTAISHLFHAVKTGEIPFEHIYGTDWWTYYSLREESSINFDRFMTGLNAISNMVIPEDYDFSSCSSVADIGGNQGQLLKSVLKHNENRKDMEGILFDQPQVLNVDVEHSWEAYGDRVKLVPGDFFKDDMPKADIYLMRMILHDWGDSKAIEILSNLSRAMSPDSKLLIIEQLITTDGSDPLSPIKTGFDLIMMSLNDGGERTEMEYNSLLQSSGLILTKIIPTRSTVTIIEARLQTCDDNLRMPP